MRRKPSISATKPRRRRRCTASIRSTQTSSARVACWPGAWSSGEFASSSCILAVARLSMQWDAHSDLVDNHEKMCGLTDQPVAALLRDLKQRGLLDSTLVIWGAEFGRLPMSQGGNGRDHNPHGFTMWFAGGGVKGGQVIGETDELGVRGIGNRYHMRDFHATILRLLGLDQNKLWYLHNGRNEKLTDFGGNVIEKVLA